MPPVINHEKCNACGICDAHCPLDVLYLEDDVLDVRYPYECWHCGACRQDCPTGAVEIDFPLIMLGV